MEINPVLPEPMEGIFYLSCVNFARQLWKGLAGNPPLPLVGHNPMLWCLRLLFPSTKPRRCLSILNDKLASAKGRGMWKRNGGTYS